MIIQRKRYEVRDGDDTYVVDKKKGVIQYKDLVTGEYIESKMTSGTVNIKPMKKSPSKNKVEMYYKNKI